MKRVSFEAAKSLKEAGYPQYGYCDSYYDFDGHLVSKFCNIKKLVYPAPYVMEAWLWLWREKRISVDIDCYNGFWSSDVNGTDCNDPEEAIIAAIEYLVEQNLIK